MLGPRQLNRVGIANAMDVLLKALPAAAADTRRVWLWAGHDTALLKEKLSSWLKEPERVYTRGVGESIGNPAWKLAFVIPRADEATEVAARVLRDGRPACVLLPTDLVHYCAQKVDGSWDSKIEKMIGEAKKIQLTAPLLTWIVHKAGMREHHVFPVQSATVPPGPTNGWTPAVGTLEQWIAEQPASRAAEAAKLRGVTFVTRDSGLQLVELKDLSLRIYVPLLPYTTPRFQRWIGPPQPAPQPPGRRESRRAARERSPPPVGVFP